MTDYAFLVAGVAVTSLGTVLGTGEAIRDGFQTVRDTIRHGEVRVPTHRTPGPIVLDSACLAAANTGSVGQSDWAGCAGMLIVDTSMLRAAGSPAIGGDGNLAILHTDGRVYTFEAGQRTLFTGQVTDMSGLFEGMEAANPEIGHWDTGRVTTMERMFKGATAFRETVAGWDTGSVTRMREMFMGAERFTEDLSGWCVENVPALPIDFDYAAHDWWSIDATGERRPDWGTCPDD